MFAGHYIPGIKVEEQWLLQPKFADPGLRPQMAPLLRYHREIWGCFVPSVAPGDNLSIKCLVEAFRIAEEQVRHRRYASAGPIGHAIRAAHQVGWSFQNAFTLIDASGSPLSLSGGSPEMLRQTYTHAYRDYWEKSLTNRLKSKYRHLHGFDEVAEDGVNLIHSAKPCGISRQRRKPNVSSGN